MYCIFSHVSMHMYVCKVCVCVCVCVLWSMIKHVLNYLNVTLSLALSIASVYVYAFVYVFVIILNDIVAATDAGYHIPDCLCLKTFLKRLSPWKVIQKQKLKKIFLFVLILLFVCSTRVDYLVVPLWRHVMNISHDICIEI